MSINEGGDVATERRSADGSDGRSPRPRGVAAAEEPGFFETLLTFLKPRVPPSLREEFAEALTRPDADETGFSQAERQMLGNILRLADVRAEDVMVPRTEIEAVHVDATLGELMNRFEQTGRSRMPVFGEGLDDVLGMVHIRDMVGHITRASLTYRHPEDGPVRSELQLARVDLSPTISDLKLLRQALFVPPSMPASELMGRMQASRIQMALVIDEYGGTDGLVSLEDILEMVVGDIEDEHDTEEALVVAAGDGVYHADARADLEDVLEVVGKEFDVGRYADEADTIGGLVLQALGRVPEVGTVVETVPGFEIEVLEADMRRVKSLRIVRIPDAPSPAGGDGHA